MDVLEAVRSRRSIGKLDGEVSEAELRALVDAALYAPNHKQTEPWRFTLVRGQARERLGEVWARVAGASTSLDGANREDYLVREARKPLRAPALLFVSTRTDPNPVTAIEDYAATSAAVQNVLLAAHAMGLGAIWRTGEMAYSDEVNAFLGLADTDRVVGIVYVGRPAMTPPPARAKNVDAVLRILE